MKRSTEHTPGYWVVADSRKKSEAIEAFFQEVYILHAPEELYASYEDLYRLWKKITPQARAELLCGPRLNSD